MPGLCQGLCSEDWTLGRLEAHPATSRHSGTPSTHLPSGLPSWLLLIQHFSPLCRPLQATLGILLDYHTLNVSLLRIQSHLAKRTSPWPTSNLVTPDFGELLKPVFSFPNQLGANGCEFKEIHRWLVSVFRSCNFFLILTIYLICTEVPSSGLHHERHSSI